MANHNGLQPLMPHTSNQYMPNCLPPLNTEGFPGMCFPPGDVPLQYGGPYGGLDQEPELHEHPFQQWPSQLPPQPPSKSPYQSSQPPVPPVEGVEPKSRPKRRSKNDSNGRDYCCGCGKTYLSYPALYTHIKIKHNGVNPAGTTLLNGGRGRGRPRKNLAAMLKPALALPTGVNLKFEQKEIDLPLKEENEDEKARGADERLNKYGVLEPTIKSALTLFEEYTKQNKPETSAAIKDLLEEVKKIYSGSEEEKSGAKNCEAVLAEYLAGMAHKVNEKFYMTLITFARLYKDCMNEHGWDLLAKYRAVTEEERVMTFTKVRDAEHVPEACNIFMNKFFLKEFPNFDPAIAMDLTMHLCEWLLIKGYTHSKISQI